MYNLISFDKCVYTCNHHLNQDIEFFHHCQKIPHLFHSQSLPHPWPQAMTFHC